RGPGVPASCLIVSTYASGPTDRRVLACVAERHLHPGLASGALGGDLPRLPVDAEDRILHEDRASVRVDHDLGGADRASMSGRRPRANCWRHGQAMVTLSIGKVKNAEACLVMAVGMGATVRPSGSSRRWRAGLMGPGAGVPLWADPGPRLGGSRP